MKTPVTDLGRDVVAGFQLLQIEGEGGEPGLDGPGAGVRSQAHLSLGDPAPEGGHALPRLGRVPFHKRQVAPGAQRVQVHQADSSSASMTDSIISLMDPSEARGAEGAKGAPFTPSILSRM